MTTREYHHSDDHGHDHPHDGCDHEHHTHEHPSPADLAKLNALLGFMLNHNREHTEELANVAHKFRHAGRNEAAGLLEDAVKEFHGGNEKLKKALDLVMGGE
jgi:hypothetical protein